jgi:hypothetical protein
MSAPAADRLVANRYALKAPLGRGGMGVVWRAHDLVLGREVAVKEVVFPPAMPDQERRPAQARVMREARAAARLNHPAVVTLYDVVQDGGGTFIVMELVDAPTLADLVRAEGPLPVEQVAGIGAQVAGALEAAHRAGIVHRDVKPGNVMVGERGTAKLADFGIASLQGDPQLTSTGLVIGSPAYMAPEQARGEESGPPADFWALGATMFYAVEGQPPFDRGTSIATLAAVVSEPPRSPRQAGPLAPLLTALLAKDPEARPSGPELRAALDRLAARPSPPTELLPSRGPGRTVQLPPPAAPVAGFPPANREAGDPRTPALSQEEDGVAPASREAGVAAAALAVEGGVVGGADREPGQAGEAPPRVVLPPAPPLERRRGRMAGVVALLVVLGLAAVLFAVNLRSGDGGRPAAAPGTTAAAAGGGSRATATTRPATSTTAAPTTTAAPATSAAAAGGLPAGWTEFVNRRGANRVGVPPGFKAHTRSSYNATVVEEQTEPKRVITVRSQNPSAKLPQASRDYRAWARQHRSGFREVAYKENQTYAGLPGAVVFEYEATIDGRRVHVRHVNVKGKTWGYNVELIVPVGQWEASQPLARQFEQAFRPLG